MLMSIALKYFRMCSIFHLPNVYLIIIFLHTNS